MKDDPIEFCQIANPVGFSRLFRPHFWIKLQRLWWHVRNEGLRRTLYRCAAIARAQVRRVTGAPTTAARAKATVLSGDVLNLQPGEWIEVKSAEEIQATLDATGKNRGLTFLPGMRPFCGRRFPVYKRLEKIYLEESQRSRSMKNTVLLSGVVCQGADYGCDRSCLYYWREAWLRRVDGPPLVRIERG